MAKFRQGHVVLKPGEKIRFDDQDVTDVSTDPSNDSTSVLMATSGIQALVAGVAIVFSEDANLNIVGGNSAGSALSAGLRGFYAGDFAGQFTDGNYNICIGYEAGKGADSQTYGFCVIIGGRAGLDLTTGNNNVAVGYLSLYENQTGDDNVCVGYQAGRGASGDSYDDCVIMGSYAGYSNRREQNTYIGKGAGYFNGSGGSSGLDNVVIGFEAGYGQNGNDYSDCVMVGKHAGYYLKTGGANCYIGYQAGRYNETGANNVVIGENAGEGVAGQSYANNVLIGHDAGNDLETGNFNIILGSFAGDQLTTGSRNIVIGYNLDVNDSTADDQFMLGSATYQFLRGDMANYILGINGDDGYLNFGADTTAVGEALGITGYGFRDNSGVMEYKDLGGSWATLASLSDMRLKENIRDYSLGLDFISKLNTKRFNFKKKPEETEEGLIAQEVKGVLDDLDAEFSGWIERPDGLQELKYNKFVIPLINAVQELKARIIDLEKISNEKNKL